MTGEEAQRRKNRPPSREEIKERERREIARSEGRRPLMFVLLFSVLLFYKAIGSDAPGDWVRGRSESCRRLAGSRRVSAPGIGRTAARFLWLVCLVGFVDNGY